MATILNTIYPPQVDTFMPSFCYNDAAKIWFNVPSYSEDKINLIQYLHISMVDQRNNVNVFAGVNSNNTVYPQYYPIVFNGNKDNNNNNNKMGYDLNKKMYWAVIPPRILKTKPFYNIGQYYKVQIRFDLTGSPGFIANDGYSNPTDYFYWNDSEENATANALQLALYTNANENNFSEWSTGTLIKPILIPELALQNFDITTRKEINPSTDIPIVGKIKFTNADDDNKSYTETEYLSWYKIQILNDNKTTILYDNNKIYPIIKNQINYKLDTSELIINTNYQIRIIYETNNGYTETIDYPIQIIDYINQTNMLYTTTINENDGIITFNITELENYDNGYLIIRRSSYHSNFNHWDLIAAYNISSLDNLIITDNTIESMTGYRYQLQYIDENNNIYAPQYVEDNIITCDFYGGLFSDKNKMLRMTFNFQPSNRSNAMNRTKVDTLGGQYPVFTQNPKLKYHTYNISGRISTEDNGELFLSKQEIFGNEYYNYRYNILAESPHVSECQSIKPNQDWLYEREYRDAVEEWLNNGKPKLFRSMTEGNMIVMLDGVSMTPDIALGRRLYDFNATMYEIGNGKDLDSIASFGLFEIIDER